MTQWELKTPGFAQRRETSSEYSQVLGFLLLRPFGADLAAAGGSGAQLGGDQEGETLHHPPSAQKKRPTSVPISPPSVQFSHLIHINSPFPQQRV